MMVNQRGMMPDLVQRVPMAVMYTPAMRRA